MAERGKGHDEQPHDQARTAAPPGPAAAAQAAKASIDRQDHRALPVSEATLRRIATWSIIAHDARRALIARGDATSAFPARSAPRSPRGSASAGFRVEQIEMTGLSGWTA